ncbi:hypothetical protein HY839_01275 [Candidatus Azambacteria bacterium]|nr:hypothetical protein [Candidatus Azambacteria bacterium]
MQTDAKKKFFDQQGDESRLAEHFATAVRDVCCMSDDAKQIIIGALIGEYVREDPNKDVLERTKELLFAMKKFTQADALVLDVPVWKEAAKEIKEKLLYGLPHQVFRRYQSDIETFFARLEHYGIAKLEKAHSAVV